MGYVCATQRKTLHGQNSFGVTCGLLSLLFGEAERRDSLRCWTSLKKSFCRHYSVCVRDTGSKWLALGALESKHVNGGKANVVNQSKAILFKCVFKCSCCLCGFVRNLFLLLAYKFTLCWTTTRTCITANHKPGLAHLGGIRSLIVRYLLHMCVINTEIKAREGLLRPILPD